MTIAQLCFDLNQRLQQMVSNHIDVNDESNNVNLHVHVNKFDKIDQIVWDAICHLTKSKSDEQQGPSLTKKNVRRAYLISQIMFSIDSRCTAPFIPRLLTLLIVMEGQVI